MKTAIICATLALFIGCVSALPQSRIVGGEAAPSDAAPYIVSLQWANDDRRQHFCAAAILDKNWLLTAAHCIQALPEDSMIKAVAGKVNLNEDAEETQQVRYVERIVIHQNFTGGISANDLALVKVDEAFEMTEAVKAIALPRSKSVVSGEVKMFGWGSVSEDFDTEYPESLQMAVTEVIGFKECQEILGGEGATPLKSSNVCTGPLEGGVSACNGDSGGPLVKTDKDGKDTLVGIISWGFFPCGGFASPSIYVNVATYTSWIKRNMK